MIRSRPISLTTLPDDFDFDPAKRWPGDEQTQNEADSGSLEPLTRFPLDVLFEARSPSSLSQALALNLLVSSLDILPPSSLRSSSACSNNSKTSYYSNAAVCHWCVEGSHIQRRSAPVSSRPRRATICGSCV